MCPKCMSDGVLKLNRQKGTLTKSSEFHALEEDCTTMFICSRCGYLLYDYRWGWETEINAKVKQFEQMARDHGLRASEAVVDFLVDMGIPRAYCPGGIYYLNRGESDGIS